MGSIGPTLTRKLSTLTPKQLHLSPLGRQAGRFIVCIRIDPSDFGQARTLTDATRGPYNGGLAGTGFNPVVQGFALPPPDVRW